MATNLQKYKSTISSSPKKLKAPVKAKATKAQTVRHDPALKHGMNGTQDGFNFLSSALQATFFFDYFEHVANKSYAGDRTDIKILKLKAVHPRFHKYAIRSDFFGRVVVYFLLIVFAAGLVAGTVWKTIIK